MERRAGCRQRRMEAQEEGRRLAHAGDRLHLQGCMLYWAEGGKDRNVVRFTNSDAAMVRLFVRFLRRCYAVSDDRMTLTISCYLGNGLELGEIESWWLDTLELPRPSLRRSHVGTAKPKRSASRSVLVHGPARVTVCSTALAQSIYGGIQEYAALDGYRWLD